MVVDDHPVVLEGFGSMIGTEPDMSVVALARSGKEAVKLFREQQPDITLMDLRMPEMSGIETIGAIRQQFPHSRFIVLTTYDGDEDIYRALEAGAQAYLLKDMLCEDILATIRAVRVGQPEATVKGHVTNILGKLGVTDRTQAVITALKRGLVHL